MGTQTLEQGILAHEQGRLYEAESAYWQVLSNDLDNTDALYLNALLTLESDKIELSFSLVSHLLEIAPSHGLALQLLARLLIKSAQYDEAIQVLSSPVFKQQPSDNAYILQAQCYCKLGNFNKAQACLRKARQLTGLSADIAFEFGNIYMAAEKYKIAQRYYQALASLDSNGNEATLLLGQCLQEQGEHEEAINLFNQLVSKQSVLPSWLIKKALTGMMNSFQILGKHETALECQHLAVVL